MPILGYGIREKAVERRNRLPITYTADGGVQASHKASDSQSTNRSLLTALSARPVVTSGLSRCEAQDDGETIDTSRILLFEIVSGDLSLPFQQLPPTQWAALKGQSGKPTGSITLAGRILGTNPNG
ncbi:hypothetical protein [Aureimonas ureilytica]|uniref:hypothetical protein n=1 Tax=Aureimonas ureilytica TaxID=401562 RepID=UPI00128F7535|nr:hypothetical protein [Aureimonas ureilytica]